MDINIKKYRKEKSAKSEMTSTGISLEIKQKEFIDEQNINLSRLVRDVINSMMVEDRKKKVS